MDKSWGQRRHNSIVHVKSDTDTNYLLVRDFISRAEMTMPDTPVASPNAHSRPNPLFEIYEPVNDYDLATIVRAAEGSPRFVKSVFRKLANGAFQADLNRIIELTNSEGLK